MAFPMENMILQQLQDRKEKLSVAIAESPEAKHLVHLLCEVDTALEKMGNGTYGICETCKDTIELDRLIADPLVRNCLAHLSEIEQRTLERDLESPFRQPRAVPEPCRERGDPPHLHPVQVVSGTPCSLLQ